MTGSSIFKKFLYPVKNKGFGKFVITATFAEILGLLTILNLIKIKSLRKCFGL